MSLENARVHGAFALEPASPEDFAELVALRHLEDWAPNAWLLTALEASGLGYVVVARAEPGARRHEPCPPIVASAVGTAYGSLGVIGNVIVHASHRARGLGRAVMEAELAWLRQRGVAHVELDATEHGRPLYEKLGFIQRAPSWMLMDTVGGLRARGRASRTSGIVIRELKPATLATIAPLDRHAFGDDRMPLLAAVLALEDTRGWAAIDGQGTATGYLFARPAELRQIGLRIGPWIAQSPQVALDLLWHAVASFAVAEMPGASVVASVPGASNVVTGCFAVAGIPLVPDDVRMRLTFGGSASAAEVGCDDWVYGMLAPMVG